MNVLMLSTDQKIFDPRAEVHQRMIGYGNLFEELHIIVYTRRGSILEKKLALAENTFVYPTNSVFRFFYFFDVFFIARKILSAKMHDSKWVVTSQDPFETCFVGYVLKRIYHLSLQIQIHTDFLSQFFWNESFKNKIRVVLGKFFIKRADGIRVVSERIRRSLVAYATFIAPRIIILPVFVEIEKIRALIIETDLHKKYSQFDFIILMASRMTREKNIGMAINAMKSVVEKYLKIGLVIVGDGPERNILQNMVSVYSLQNNVILEPWVDNLVSYYKTADCYVLTSNYEGYGRTVLEAMASGCPVVMTDVGVAGEIVKNGINGSIVKINHHEELARAITSLFVDAPLRKKYTAAGYETIAALRSKNNFFELWKTSLENSSVYYSRQKLCYILPEYNKEDATHFAHVQDFIREITKSINVYLIIERGGISDDKLGAEKICAAQSNIILLAWHIFRARMAGYRNYYIHYSFRAALVSALLVRWNGGTVFYWNCGEPWKFRRSFAREQFERLVYRMISFLVTGTVRMKEAYAREYHIPLSKIKILPNWINTKRFVVASEASILLRNKLGIDAGTKVILFVHRLSKRKGADLIVPVFQELHQQNADIVMLVIGSGPEEKKIQEVIMKEKLKNKIWLLGSVPNIAVKNYFALADVFFMPSQEEGFPRVLLEAMAMGVPFVAYDVGGVRDVVPPETMSYVFDTRDPRLLAETIQKLFILKSEERTKLNSALIKWTSQYDIKQVISRFFDLIYENN